jgi:hypothetical protein
VPDELALAECGDKAYLVGAVRIRIHIVNNCPRCREMPQPEFRIGDLPDFAILIFAPFNGTA